MSSHEYWLRGWFPFSDPEEEVVAQAGRVLGVEVTRQDWGPEVTSEALSVHALLPEDPDEEDEVPAFEINAMVVFEEFGRPDEGRMIRANENVVRVAASFAAGPQVRAVLLEGNSDDGLVMTIQDGHVVLNQDWDGWTVWPEVLAAVPQPYEMRSIRVS